MTPEELRDAIQALTAAIAKRSSSSFVDTWAAEIAALADEITVLGPTIIERRSGVDRRQGRDQVNPGRRQGQRRGKPRQYPATPAVAYVTITSASPPAMNPTDTWQLVVLVESDAVPHQVLDVDLQPVETVERITLGDRTITYSSTDTNIATVDADGLITAVAAGSCTIRATCEGVWDTEALTVVNPAATVATVTVTPSTAALIPAGTVVLAAVVKDASNNVLTGKTVTWGTSNGGRATVSADSGDEAHEATVTAVAAGADCTITATCETVDGTCTVSVAAAGSFVTFADPDVAVILGPQMISGDGGNPWPWFDTNYASCGTTLAGTIPGFFPVSNPAGSVAVTNGSTSVVGTGTSFLTTVSTTNRLWILDVNGTSWRGPYYPAAVVDDTHITLAANWTFGSASGTDWKTNHTGQSNEEVGFFWGFTTYYDLPMVMYNEYYRTGDATYQTAARKAADAWFDGLANDGVDQNYGVAPRVSILCGLMLRAIDGRPEMWDWIWRYTNVQFDVWLYTRRNDGELYFGLRDGAFMLLFATMLAQVLPDSYESSIGAGTITNGATKRANFLSKAVEVAVNYHARLQTADGGFEWRDDWIGQLGKNATWGCVGFHVGYLLEALVALHRYLEGNATYTTERATIGTMITDICDFVWTDLWRDLESPGDMPNTDWRCLRYAIFKTDALSPIQASNVNGDINTIKDGRQLNSMVIHAFGYAYKITADSTYKTRGDEIFAATYGAGQGPSADAYTGLAFYITPYDNQRGKEFDQGYRSAGRYLAWRAGA